MKKQTTQTFDNTIDTVKPVQETYSWFNAEQLYVAVAIVIIIVGIIVGSGK